MVLGGGDAARREAGVRGEAGGGSGEYGEARQIHLQLGEMFKALFEEGNPAGIKAALHARGVIACQKLRSPLCEVSEALYQKIKRLGE